jgi:hypothetical protein
VDACNPLLQAHPTWARDEHEGRGIPTSLTPVSGRLASPPFVLALALDPSGLGHATTLTRRPKGPPGLETPTDRFPDLRKSKLMPCAAGPYKVLAKINDNAYTLELPLHFGVSPTFNILDLKPYMGEKDEIESRMTPIQEGEDDEDITSIHTMHGSIT